MRRDLDIRRMIAVKLAADLILTNYPENTRMLIEGCRLSEADTYREQTLALAARMLEPCRWPATVEVAEYINSLTEDQLADDLEQARSLVRAARQQGIEPRPGSSACLPLPNNRNDYLRARAAVETRVITSWSELTSNLASGRIQLTDEAMTYWLRRQTEETSSLVQGPRQVGRNPNLQQTSRSRNSAYETYTERDEITGEEFTYRRRVDGSDAPVLIDTNRAAPSTDEDGNPISDARREAIRQAFGHRTLRDPIVTVNLLEGVETAIAAAEPSLFDLLMADASRPREQAGTPRGRVVPTNYDPLDEDEITRTTAEALNTPRRSKKGPRPEHAKPVKKVPTYPAGRRLRVRKREEKDE